MKKSIINLYNMDCMEAMAKMPDKAYDLGFDLDGYEIDKDYYDGACERLEKYKKQPRLL